MNKLTIGDTSVELEQLEMSWCDGVARFCTDKHDNLGTAIVFHDRFPGSKIPVNKSKDVWEVCSYISIPRD